MWVSVVACPARLPTASLSGEGLLVVVERFLRVPRVGVDQPDVGERGGLSALVLFCFIQAQHFQGQAQCLLSLAQALLRRAR